MNWPSPCVGLWCDKNQKCFLNIATPKLVCIIALQEKQQSNPVCILILLDLVFIETIHKFPEAIVLVYFNCRVEVHYDYQ